jgi:integrase
VTTFGAWADEWLKSNPGKSPSVLARDESIVRCHLRSALGARRLVSITSSDVQSLVNVWATAARPRTVSGQYDTLGAILNAAAEAEMIGRSPCRKIHLPGAVAEDRPIVDATELAALAEAIGPRYGAMAYVGSVLGLRWGEVAGLRVGRLDFLNRTVTVAEQRTRGARDAVSGGCQSQRPASALWPRHFRSWRCWRIPWPAEV